MDGLTSHPLRYSRLHGIDAGPETGPLVILLHGFPDFFWGWRKQIAPLTAQGFRVIAPDQRGYYLSDKPLPLAEYRVEQLAADVIALADACGHTTFRLVGHDWGGLIAWWVAALHPRRIEQLVILNAPHPHAWSHLVRHRWQQALKSWYIAFFQLPWLPEIVLSAGRFALLRLVLRRSARRGIFTASSLEPYRAAWSHPGALTAMLNYYRALRQRPKDLPARIRAPTLLIWGERDRFLDRALAEASLKLCDSPIALFLPTATHWVHLEEPETVNSAIATFFSRSTNEDNRA